MKNVEGNRFQVDDAANQCGSAEFADCLLNQLGCVSPDESAGTQCVACNKTLDDLDAEALQLGVQLGKPSGPLSENGYLQAIENAACRPPRIETAATPTEIGTYRIGDLLGQGGMGAVYRATHKYLKTDVAIKLLSEETIDSDGANLRFEREIEAVGKLLHPNVVRALDAGDTNGTRFLIMELLSGADVSQIVAGQKSLDAADACEIARQAALGLQHAHDQNLIHRDVKPGNLMLTEDADGQPVVKVMDLGLALLNRADVEQLTDQGFLMGTLKFIAPEQAENTSDVDHRADIYALGATLFRLLSGEVPYHGKAFNTPAKRLAGLMNQQAASLATVKNDLPASLIALVDGMLSRDPAQRPQSMNDVASQLTRFSAGHNLKTLSRQAIENHKAEPEQQVEIALADTSPRNSATAFDQPAMLSPNGSGSATNHWRRWWMFAALPLLAMLLGVIWLKTDGGYLRIDAEPGIDLTVKVLKDGAEVKAVKVGKQKNEFWFRSGQYEIRLPAEAADEFEIDGDSFTLTRNGNSTVTIVRVEDANEVRPESSHLADQPGPDKLPDNLTYWQRIAADGATTHLRFDEKHGNVAQDSISLDGLNNASHHGTDIQTTTGPTNGLRTAAKFGGTNFFRLRLDTAKSFTVEVWARSNTEEWNNDGWIVSSRSRSDSFFVIHPESGSKGWSGLIGEQFVGSHDIEDIRDWHQYVISFDDETKVARMYSDGQLVAKKRLPEVTLTNRPVEVWLGRDQLDHMSRYGKGAIDEFAFYKSALSDDQIRQHFLAASAAGDHSKELQTNRKHPDKTQREKKNWIVENTNDDGPGSLRRCISAASDGDVIRFDKSLSGQTITLTSGQITITNSLTVTADDLPQPVTLDAAFQSRIFEMPGQHNAHLSKCLFSNLRLTRGKAMGGAAILSNSCDLTLNRMIIDNNIADRFGGGICSRDNLTMTDCTISGNLASTGGGIACWSGDVTMDGCTFFGNTGKSEGGGWYRKNHEAESRIVNTTFFGNSSKRGAAASIHNSVDGVVLQHVTMTANTSDSGSEGSALWLPREIRMVIENTVIAGNECTNADVRQQGKLVLRGRNFIGSLWDEESDTVSYPAAHKNPMFGPPGTYGGRVMVVPLLSGSPLIDAGMIGNRLEPVRTDTLRRQRAIAGNADVSAKPDIGAVEFDPKRDANLRMLATRKLAEWLLAHEGGFWPANEGLIRGPDAEIPKADFEIYSVEVHGATADAFNDFVRLATAVPSIRKLLANSKQGSPGGPKSLMMLSRFTQLDRLDLSDWRLTAEDWDLLKPLQSLTKLGLIDVAVNKDVVQRLQQNFPQLTSLDLMCRSLPDKTLVPVADMINLRFLSLSPTHLTGNAAENIAATSITNLTLRSIETIDADVMPFLAKTPQLQTVDLFGNAFNNDHLRHLAKSKSLTKLNLRGTSVTEGAAAEFREQNPSIKLSVD